MVTLMQYRRRLSAEYIAVVVIDRSKVFGPRRDLVFKVSPHEEI